LPAISDYQFGGQAELARAEQLLAAKKRIQELAESARQSLLAKLQLSERKDVASFSLASDIIEQFKQIAHFARQIARIVEQLNNLKTRTSDGSSSYSQPMLGEVERLKSGENK
jgi:hypothetical protein